MDERGRIGNNVLEQSFWDLVTGLNPESKRKKNRKTGKVDVLVLLQSDDATVRTGKKTIKWR